MKNKHLIPEDGIEIAWLGGSWHLYHRPSRSTEEWMNLKLVDVDSYRQHGQLRTFHLGWNGTRFAINSDLERLIACMPELHDAVEKVLLLASRQRELGHTTETVPSRPTN
ncbi:MAG: hypothetical protein AB2552_21020 [Candidatus Thiodiazotropha endolucinida]